MTKLEGGKASQAGNPHPRHAGGGEDGMIHALSNNSSLRSANPATSARLPPPRIALSLRAPAAEERVQTPPISLAHLHRGQDIHHSDLWCCFISNLETPGQGTPWLAMSHSPKIDRRSSTVNTVTGVFARRVFGQRCACFAQTAYLFFFIKVSL